MMRRLESPLRRLIGSFLSPRAGGIAAIEYNDHSTLGLDSPCGCASAPASTLKDDLKPRQLLLDFLEATLAL